MPTRTGVAFTATAIVSPIPPCYCAFKTWLPSRSTREHVAGFHATLPSEMRSAHPSVQLCYLSAWRDREISPYPWQGHEASAAPPDLEISPPAQRALRLTRGAGARLAILHHSSEAALGSRWDTGRTQRPLSTPIRLREGDPRPRSARLE